MFENLDSTTITAIASLVGAVFAGTGLKVIEHWLKKTKDKQDTATELRDELRKELTQLKTELAKAEMEIDTWRQRYYEVIEQYILVKMQLQAVVRVLRSQGIEIPPLIQSLTEEDKP